MRGFVRGVSAGAGWLFQIDGAVGGGETGGLNGAGAGEAILNTYDVGGVIGEVCGPGGFAVYKESEMAVAAGHAEGGPLGEVAAEAGEVGVPAGCPGAGGV